MHMTYEVHIWIYRVSEHVIIKMCWNCLLRLQLTAYFLYFWTDITDVTHDSLWMANFVDWQLTAVAWKMTPKDRAVLLFFVFSHSATHLNTSPLLLILKQEASEPVSVNIIDLTWLGGKGTGERGQLPPQLPASLWLRSCHQHWHDCKRQTGMFVAVWHWVVILMLLGYVVGIVSWRSSWTYKTKTRLFWSVSVNGVHMRQFQLFWHYTENNTVCIT